MGRRDQDRRGANPAISVHCRLVLGLTAPQGKTLTICHPAPRESGWFCTLLAKVTDQFHRVQALPQIRNSAFGG